MKIQFDFKDIDPKVIGEVVQIAMNEIKSIEKRHEGLDIEFGTINLYLSTKERETGETLYINNADGKNLEWTVKPKPMKWTKKKEYISTDNFTIYQ